MKSVGVRLFFAAMALVGSAVFNVTPVYSKTVVNDVTLVNPIEVRQVVAPKTSEEIRSLIKVSPGPISIGGGRFSMGGQTATENALQIDMRSFNKILNVDVQKKKVTVQSGIRWRDLQEEIDKYDLSVKVMQTYSNFTVGGSLSVNVHGRYVGEGPIIRTVDSIKVVLADGREVSASKTENPDIFFSAIGGYGGIGVITEVTLNLTSNEKIRREVKRLPVGEYKTYFQRSIRDDKTAVFHNGDLYPPDYQTVSLETWYRTDKKLTSEERLIPQNKKYWLEPSAISSISSLPFGAELRRNVFDPIVHRNEVVVWRNHEASYDVAQLEPTTPRLLFTYVLQEYFVPTERFDEFVPKMSSIFRRHNVNVINVSIRHAFPDPGSYLAWAPDEVFSFVIYYRQGTSESAKKRVKQWTRELVDAAIAVGGRHYLPYQIHATEDQFRRGYKNFQKFFDVKTQYDPTNKFRNKLWDAYYPK